MRRRRDRELGSRAREQSRGGSRYLSGGGRGCFSRLFRRSRTSLNRRRGNRFSKKADLCSSIKDILKRRTNPSYLI